MGPLHKTVTWYKITPCWMANDAKEQEKQKDYINQKAKYLFSSWSYHIVRHPARCLSYNVTTLCTEPIHEGEAIH